MGDKNLKSINIDEIIDKLTKNHNKKSQRSFPIRQEEI